MSVASLDKLVCDVLNTHAAITRVLVHVVCHHHVLVPPTEHDRILCLHDRGTSTALLRQLDQVALGIMRQELELAAAEAHTCR